MNEEEFREILLNLGYKFDINKREEEFCLLCIKKGFQKGKLEQMKEDIKIIKRKQREAFDNKLFKVGYGWNNCAFILLKQLSKEIGEMK